MLKKRIIACLDVANGNVVKGIQFKGHKVVGDMYELAARYSDQGVDELVFYDILASPERRSVNPGMVEKIAKRINIPFSVAGGIKSTAEARDILSAGAEKVSVNSMALRNPEIIRQMAYELGSQAVVVGVDSRLERDSHNVYQYTGSQNTVQNSQWKTNDWLLKVQELGAGEIVLNSMDSDGMRKGFDISQINLVTKGIRIPIVASGGAGKAQDFSRVFMETKVTGALAAGIFHSKLVSISNVRLELLENNIPTRKII